MNLQVVEKQIKESDTISVVDIFETIQGEGPFVGYPCVFIRLAGCNLQCPKCDTDYTSNRVELTVKQIVNKVLDYNQNLVVISGGEPFRQDIGGLICQLFDNGFRIQVETNGIYCDSKIITALKYGEVTVVCSPKTTLLNKYLLPYINYLKYIIRKDYTCPIDGLPNDVLGTDDIRPMRPWNGFKGIVYVQPLWEEDKEATEANTKVAIDKCLKYGYSLSIQTHKIIGVK